MVPRALQRARPGNIAFVSRCVARFDMERAADSPGHMESKRRPAGRSVGGITARQAPPKGRIVRFPHNRPKADGGAIHSPMTEDELHSPLRQTVPTAVRDLVSYFINAAALFILFWPALIEDDAVTRFHKLRTLFS